MIRSSNCALSKVTRPLIRSSTMVWPVWGVTKRTAGEIPEGARPERRRHRPSYLGSSFRARASTRRASSSYCAVTEVGLAFGHQSLGVLLVEGHACGLVDRSLIPVQPNPLQA